MPTTALPTCPATPWISSWIPSSAPIAFAFHVVTSNLQVTTLSEGVNPLRIRFVYERTGIRRTRGCALATSRCPHSCWGPVDPARGAGLACRTPAVQRAAGGDPRHRGQHLVAAAQAPGT